MLTLHSDQHEWILQREQELLASLLEQALPNCWTQLAQQLGPRTAAFVRAALKAADEAGLASQRQAVRLFNLWCVWGPNFESKPGFEWASEILQSRHRASNIRIQQLCLQSRARLQSLKTQITVEDFDRHQAYLLALMEHGAATTWIKQDAVDGDPTLLCDFSAIEVELSEQPWRQESHVELTPAGDLVAIRQAPPAPKQVYRIDRAPEKPTPWHMAVLAAPMADGAKTVLHVRADVAHVCDTQVHPRMTWTHSHGVETSMGHGVARRLIHSLPDEAVRLGASVTGLGRTPVSHTLDLKLETCGLRLAGAPIAEQQLGVEVWPADQWLAEIRAVEQSEWTWPTDTRETDEQDPSLLLAVNGVPVSTQAWREGWQKLIPMFKQGVSKWARGIERASSIERLRMAINPGLMHGHGMFTWGMREDVTDEGGSSAFLRFQSDGQWTACASQIQMSGDFKHDDAWVRIRLRSAGKATLPLRAHRASSQPGLPQVISELKTTWQHPFEIEFEAVANSSLKTISLDVTESWGGLTGEAGLRARSDGQGYEWYCQMGLAPTCISYTVWDPILGPQRYQRELWPAMSLLDWSAG